MKIFKAFTIGIVLTTVVSCSSLDIRELPKNSKETATHNRGLDSQKKSYESIGIYSPGDKLRGDLMLEDSLSDSLYKKKIRNITSSRIVKGSENRALGPVVKILKRDNFEALLIIKNLEVASTSFRSPDGTVGNNIRGSLLLKKESQPLRTLTAQIEFIDLKSKNTLWTGELTFQDANNLPMLIQKTAEGITEYLSKKNFIQ